MSNGEDERRPFNEVMVREITRYGSFQRWQGEVGPWPSRLAAAGFYCDGNGQDVVCFSCGLSLKNSDSRLNSSPMDTHRLLSRECPFIINGGGNAPIVVHPDDRPLSWRRLGETESVRAGPLTPDSRQGVNSQNMDETLLYSSIPPFTNTTHIDRTPVISQGSFAHIDSITHGYPNNQPSVSRNQGTDATLLENESNVLSQASSGQGDLPELPTTATGMARLGIITRQPKYPDQAVCSNRIRTFEKNWPRHKTQTAEDLAEAGFFFSGKGDGVKCFFCGLGLINWMPGDNPWIEHARVADDCPFLDHIRGTDFVRFVKELNADGSQIDYNQVNAILNDMQGNTTRTVPPKGSKVAEGTSVVQTKEDQELLEENERLKQQTTCKVCLTEEVGTVFIPCGHIVCCVNCALAVPRCPMCRSQITGRARVHI